MAERSPRGDEEEDDFMNYIKTYALEEFFGDIVKKCFENRAENPRLFVIEYLKKQSLEEQNKKGESAEKIVYSDALQTAPTVLGNDSDEDMEPIEKTNVSESPTDPYFHLFAQNLKVNAAELVENFANLQPTNDDEASGSGIIAESLAQPMETENQMEHVVESPPEHVEPIQPRRSRRRKARKM